MENFVLIDNDSTDDSRALCLSRSDLNITLYNTKAIYRKSRSGLDWTNAVIKHIASKGDYWIVLVDLDELLVYPGSEEISLRQLTWYLTKRARECMLTPMIDMYPDANIHSDNASLTFADSRYYDYTDYTFQQAARFPFFQIFGGARRRYVKKSSISLKKVALFNTSAGVYPAISTHAYTDRMDLCQTTGALLHYKFSASYLDKLRRESIEKRRTQTKDYENYLKKTELEINLYDTDLSHEYLGSLDLVNDQLMWASFSYVNHFSRILSTELRDALMQSVARGADRKMSDLIDLMVVIISSSKRIEQ